MYEEKVLPALQQGHGAHPCRCSPEALGDQEDLGDREGQLVQPGLGHPDEKWQETEEWRQKIIYCTKKSYRLIVVKTTSTVNAAWNIYSMANYIFTLRYNKLSSVLLTRLHH